MTAAEKPLRRVLLLDCETTGLDDTAQCIEVAVAIFDVERAEVLRSYASLMRAESNAAKSVNRIPVACLLNAQEPARVWDVVMRWADICDAIVAHGADFDRRFVPEPVDRARPWICSRLDLAWPMSEKPGESLVKLALVHGLGVAHAHRAAVDVETMGRLFHRVAELARFGLAPDLPTMLARGLRPKAVFQALVPFERKDEAKALGFEWEAPTKRWLRRMAIEDAAALPFPTVNVDSGERVAGAAAASVSRGRIAALDLPKEGS